MSFPSRSTRIAFALLALTLAVPSFAAGGKRRAVGPSVPAVVTKLRGTVTDAANGRPVVFATVVAGELSATTDAEGKFELDVPGGSTITITRSGYTTVTRTIATGTATVAITMNGLPSIRLKTTTNKEYELDMDGAEFAYMVPFSGYVRSDNGKFCKPDGSDYRPNKTTIKRFIGPAVSSTNEACCKDRPILKARIELKSGEQTDVYFTDSCFGYEVDFIARDHYAGEFVFLKFNDITEIVFP